MPTSRPLNRSDVKTLSLSALGGALEFYDFVVFVFFAAVIGKLFFPAEIPEWLRRLQTFGLFAAGYLARPLGGIVLAHFGDRLGRKRMFTLSIFLMSVPTLAMGLLPTWQMVGIWAPILLLLLRVAQGAAIGGEVPGAWVFVSEHVPERHVGFACGTLTGGLTFGILLGSLVAAGLNAYFGPDELHAWAWRLPFLIGGGCGLLSVRLRRWLHETPVFAELQARKALARELPLRSVFRDHRKAVVLSMFFTWVISAGIVVVILMAPTLLQTIHGVAPATAMLAGSVAIVFLTAGCVSSGWLADRFGAGRTILVGCLLLSAACLAFFAGVRQYPEWLFPLYALAGLATGAVGAMPSVMVRAFPAPVRFSGLSFSYNLAYAFFGGLTPIAVSLILELDPLAPGAYVAALGLGGAAVGAALASGGRELTESAHPTS